MLVAHSFQGEYSGFCELRFIQALTNQRGGLGRYVNRACLRERANPAGVANRCSNVVVFLRDSLSVANVNSNLCVNDSLPPWDFQWVRVQVRFDFACAKHSSIGIAK